MGQMMQRTIGMICGMNNRYFPNTSREEAQLMLWAGFSNGVKTNIAFPTGRMKACWILISYLLGSDWRSIWNFSVRQCYYSCCKLHLGMVSADWGTRTISPDLNPMENL